jgi:hypothetical protein
VDDARVENEDERRQAAWLDWTHENLGRDPERAGVAATAAHEAIQGGKGIALAYEAARLAYGPIRPSADETQVLDRPATLRERLAAWQAAGIVDAATVARIETFESERPTAERPPGISVSEVIAYVGTVVLLVGVGFLYGTRYEALGSVGRLTLIGLVVAGGLAAGELVRRMGATGASRRARAAGWTVAAIASATWFAQAFVDAHVLTQTARYDYQGAPPDTSGSVMLGAGLGFGIAAALLARAGAGFIAVATAALAFATAGAFDTYDRSLDPNSTELSWVLAAVILAVLAETITRGHDRRWAREILRFTATLPPVIAALGLSFSTDAQDLEVFAGIVALGAFGLALVRGSAGYAIAGGVALFIVVNEVGFRHFAESLGFPVVLIVSGIALFVVAGGLVRLLPRLIRGS